MNLRLPLILASSSPRRQFLMREIGASFTVVSPDVDESFPGDMPVVNIPAYLAQKKASVFKDKLNNQMVLTADTVVILGDQVLNKPRDAREAHDMLSAMSGKTHTVITAVCLSSEAKTDTFGVRTAVTFRTLSADDMTNYIENRKPFDKAGAYGAQECLPPGFNPCSIIEIDFLKSINKFDLIEKSISHAGEGMIAIEKIEGSYFNVMGLPLVEVYERLNQF